MSDTCSVKVAVRVRPLISQEISKGCKEIVEIIPENDQIILRSCEKYFSFNYVLGMESPQEELYERCVKPLVKNLFEGLNVTIFAYGQTGSGKTHSMGTAYSGEVHNMGVIPRIVNEIFDLINDEFCFNFNVSVSFTELYREVLYDLLADKRKDQCTLDIREDSKGFYIPNLTEVAVNSAKDILDLLQKGSLGRATASTNMNTQSSRSHSIFTVNIALQHKTEKFQNKTAKLHLVDLAGSERPKKTGAQGTVFKEGVDINKGLFVLGNVISALGDEKLQHGFIPYRDSNLTRLLKDSLGGNSVTLMIACISPADYNLEETISTLRYADRARKIKNKPVINQDPKVAEINELKRQIKQLQLQIVGQGGPAISALEIHELRTENQEQSLKIRDLQVKLSEALLDKTGLHEKVLIFQNGDEALSKKLLEIRDQCNATFSNISKDPENNDTDCIKKNIENLLQIKEDVNILYNEKLKTETEIRDHEETFKNLLDTAKNTSIELPKEIQEKQECHTTRQMVLNSELQEISKQLLLKEQLAKQLQINTRYMVDEQAMLETERKIETLEKEKEQLLKQLRNVKTHEASSKIAEQRRKRVQELEEQLRELQKKITGQSKLIKLKEKDEQKIKQLHQEILSMKSMKVKLVKQMREESDKFRNWKQQTERELARVKQQGRKKETEMAKMKVTYEKQKNVLKRKFEEAAALNKRLQKTLMKRKQAQETRFMGKVEKVAAWMKEDLEDYLNLIEAESTLAGLLEDRATLQQQLDELKNQGETANYQDIKMIEEDIELRSVQIQDLQQKLLDSKDETKSKTGFDTIQTMVEAKHALKIFYELAAESHKEKVQLKRDAFELKDVQKELRKKDELVKSMEDKYSEQFATQQRIYEEKVAILLRQLRGIKLENESKDSELINRCQILEERIDQQEKELENYEKTNNELRKRLEEIEKKSLEAITPLNKKIRMKNPPNDTVTTNTVREDDGMESDDMLECSLIDDVDNDPDWRKTPLGKRILAEKRNKTVRHSQLDLEPSVKIKRSSDGGCTCKTSCTSIRCGCQKLHRSCGTSCKCSTEVCENRLEDEDKERNSTPSSSINAQEDGEGGAFKRPRVEDEAPPSQRIKHRSKPIFLLK